MEPSKRFSAHSAISQEMTNTRGLDEFVSKSTQTFFDRLVEIQTEFLDQGSATWEKHEGFKKRLSIMKELQFVNNIVERGVASIERYNPLMTNNQDEMQLQVVEQHRRPFPN